MEVSRTKKDLKSEIINLLTPLFGEGVKDLIVEYYDNKNPQELVEIARHMLVAYLGEDAADSILQQILEEFPDIKIRVN